MDAPEGVGPERPAWLPELILFGGDWEQFEAAIYKRFCADFINERPVFRGKPVNVIRTPAEKGKATTFWHVVTSEQQEDRLPDLRRCERIGWPRALLEAAETDRRVWTYKRGSYTHFGVALPDFAYVVFIRQWPGSFQLLTAYDVEKEWRRAKYRREWDLGKC